MKKRVEVVGAIPVPCGEKGDDPMKYKLCDAVSDDEFDDDSCYHCGGARYVITCPDDLCANSDSCMHGDGEEDCPVCNADGDHEWNI